MYQVIEFYEQNLRLSRETGDRRGEMSALGSLGRAHAALEQHDKAVECYEQALRIARQIGDARSERQTLKHLNEIPKPAGEDLKKSDQTNPPQKPRGKNNSTWRQPTKQSRAGKKPRQTKDQ